jgi:hypothetical protein
MASDWQIRRNDNSLSVRFFWLVVQLWAGNLACLSIFTHLAQIIGLRFESYAWLCATLFVFTTLGILWTNRNKFAEIKKKDFGVTFLLLALALLTAVLSVSLHEFRRVGPDEYFYAVNPVYYLNHPAEPMNYTLRLFYSAQPPLKMVAFQTANAYEYIQALLAYWTGLSFATIFYVVFAALGGLLITIGIFLALSCFSNDTVGSLIGTCVSVSTLTMLAEANWTPGALSFVRVFEGKSVMMFAGLPLFAAFSLRYLTQRNPSNWLGLFALTVALTGISTSAIMLLPFLGTFFFFIHWFLFESRKTVKTFFIHAVTFYSTYIYLVLFGVYVAWMDRVSTASAITKPYATTFDGYIGSFVSSTLPLTPIVLFIFSIIALALTRGKLRKFLFMWILAVPLFVYNSLAAKLLLVFFRGVYFRFAYLYPFPLIVGISCAAMYSWTARSKYRPLILFVFVLMVLATFMLPTSIFRSNRFAWMPWYEYKEQVVARELVKVAPKGVMLAPFPISGAVTMLDPDYPQMLSRFDVIEPFLDLQGLQQESRLRIAVDSFLQNNNDSLAVFLELLRIYPEIHSIVMRNEVYVKYGTAINELDFRNTRQLGGWRVLWK